ncbi:TolC family protein [Rhizosphaericola mali]|uniref:TolC family protein n=1 Tax=Rhizosphaericola mali TaxID=2545455 RepID=A0A5P2FYT2_9BACT|nr:TolC family protein [Rhizosphaericola mali]QES88355.1 TolC family protein [Rhizosphaericola mali]
MRLIWLFLIFHFPIYIYAQSDTSNWDLKRCISFGLQNNRNRTIYYNKKQEADAKAQELLAGYLPSVSLNGSLDDNLKLQETVIPAGAFSPTDIKIAMSKQFAMNTTAQLDQTIFDKSLLVGLKANKLNKQQADLNVRLSEETIIYNISKSYYQIKVYREQLYLLNSNLENYIKQVDISQLQVNKGVLLQKELDKVSVDRNNTISKIRVAQSNLELSINQLKYDMGYPFDDTISLDTTTEIVGVIGKTASNVSDTPSFFLQNITDYKIDEITMKADKINAEKIKAQMYPKLTAYAKYGTVGFGDYLGQTFQGTSPFAGVGLKLSFPILDFYKRNAQYKQAKFQSMNSMEQLKLNADKYRLDYKNAYNKMDQEQGNVIMDKNNIQLAESVLATTNLQYQKGVTDMTDWINAQNSLKEAQTNYLNSLYNYLMAKVDMEKSAGTLIKN